MLRISLVAAAAFAALSATACAQTQTDTQTNEVVATPIAPPPADVPAVAAATTSGYTDTQLQAFATASLEIDPISRTLATATPEQQTQAATQIRGVLERNGLDGATYNAIAAQAQTDTTLAARIAELQTGQTGAMPSDASTEMPDEEAPTEE